MKPVALNFIDKWRSNVIPNVTMYVYGKLKWMYICSFNVEFYIA